MRKGRFADPGAGAPRAMDEALRLLSYRQYSTSELQKKLRSRGCAEEEISGAVRRLTELGYLDDEALARGLALSRIRQRRWGRIKVACLLKRRGIASEVADRVIDEIDATEELNAAREVLERWLRRNDPGGTFSRDVAMRAMRHLRSRGFSSSTVSSVINRPDDPSCYDE